jgi:hypothetical protein
MMEEVLANNRSRQLALDKAFATLLRGSPPSAADGALSEDAVLEVLARFRPHYTRDKLRILYEELDPPLVGYVSKSNFPRIVQVLNRRIRHHATALDLPLTRIMAVALSLNALVVLAVCTLPLPNLHVFVAVALSSLLISGVTVLQVLTTTTAFPDPSCSLSSQALKDHPVSYFQRPGSLWCSLSAVASFVCILGGAGLVWKTRQQLFIRWLLALRCLDLCRLLFHSKNLSLVAHTVWKMAPAILVQLSPMFALLHSFAWLGMLLFGGQIPQPREDAAALFPEDPWHGSNPYYYKLNFDSYREALVTLCVVAVVNNWNVVAEGYHAAVSNRMWFVARFLAPPPPCRTRNRRPCAH